MWADDKKLYDFSYNEYGIWIDAVKRTSGEFFSKDNERLNYTGRSWKTVETIDQEIYVAAMVTTQYSMFYCWTKLFQVENVNFTYCQV